MDYLSKNFVNQNYVLKYEVNAVNALLDIGEVAQESDGKSKEELFNKLSENYKNEKKSLFLLDNNSNIDT